MEFGTEDQDWLSVLYILILSTLCIFVVSTLYILNFHAFILSVLYIIYPHGCMEVDLYLKSTSGGERPLMKGNLSGWDKTNFLGRDREIRLMKIHYETEKKWMLIF